MTEVRRQGELEDHFLRVARVVAEGSYVSPAAALDLLARSFQLFTARCDGRIVAHAALTVIPAAPHRMAASVAVEPEYQGRGLGSTVLAAALAWADAAGVAWVDGVVWSHNERALRMDRALGFVEVGRLEDAFRRDGQSLCQVSLARKRGG